MDWMGRDDVNQHAKPLAERLLQPRINTNSLAYCPTMDLIAISTEDKQVRVFRLNGQEVFAVSSNSCTATTGSVKWKPNGEVLQVSSLKVHS